MLVGPISMPFATEPGPRIQPRIVQASRQLGRKPD
jgi:hypothetical protein